jgi:hypothetical protein
MVSTGDVLSVGKKYFVRKIDEICSVQIYTDVPTGNAYTGKGR